MKIGNCEFYMLADELGVDVNDYDLEELRAMRSAVVNDNQGQEMKNGEV